MGRPGRRRVRASRGLRANALPLHFQATDLGTYLLYGDRTGLRRPRDDRAPAGPSSAATPSEDADWTVTRSGSTYLFRLGGGQGLAVAPDGTLATGTPARFRLHTTPGCAAWPEVQDNISGRTVQGRLDDPGGARLVDAHTHGMAFEFLGGDVHCGRPWHPYGVTYALKDCPDHYLANGKGAALEDLLNSGTPGTGTTRSAGRRSRTGRRRTR